MSSFAENRYPDKAFFVLPLVQTAPMCITAKLKEGVGSVLRKSIRPDLEACIGAPPTGAFGSIHRKKQGGFFGACSSESRAGGRFFGTLLHKSSKPFLCANARLGMGIFGTFAHESQAGRQFARSHKPQLSVFQ